MKTFLNRFNIEYFFSVPPETQIIWFWFGCFAILFLTTFLFYIFLRSKGKNLKPYKKYSKSFFWPNLSLALAGLILTFSRYEKLSLLSYRFWVYVTILITVVFNVWFFTIKRNRLDDELLKFRNSERKNKWLKTDKK
jgi:amino acid transporter